MSEFKIDTSNYSQVNYFGLVFSVPKKYEWIATDSNNMTCLYTEMPDIDTECFIEKPGTGTTYLPIDIHFSGDWRQSLKKVSDILVKKDALDAPAKLSAVIFEAAIAHAKALIKINGGESQ